MRLTKAEIHTGAMVALYPSPATAAMLAQPGGEAADELHVTLAFLGEASQLDDVARLQQAVAGFAATAAPLVGQVSGTGRFTAGPEPVTYASVDLPALPEIRERLVATLSGAGCEPSKEHGFTPHITLAYDDRDVQVPNLPLVFDAITVAVSGERSSYPLRGVAKAAGGWICEECGWEGDRPAAHETATGHETWRTTSNPSVAKSAHATVERTVPIWKAGDGQRIVYGVVLQPGVVDSQGDIVSAEEIEQAAHRYLVESRKHDLQHMEELAPVEVVESYIAPMDMEVAGRRVLKGSWVMASQIRDATIWQAVLKGHFTGYSIGGTAVRV